MKRESAYQAKLIKKLRRRFPGCYVLKNDSGYLQGIPDLTIFWYDMWAMLEVKMAKDSDRQPNQEFYINLFGGMSYAAFIYPSNEEQVLNELQQAFSASRAARLAQPQ